MCFYSTKEVSEFIGWSERTLYRRIAELGYEKKRKGRFYTEEEAIQLAKKLHVPINIVKLP